MPIRDNVSNQQQLQQIYLCKNVFIYLSVSFGNTNHNSMMDGLDGWIWIGNIIWLFIS